MKRQKKSNRKQGRVETVEEALARGVKVEILPPSNEVKEQRIRDEKEVKKSVVNVKGVPASALDIKCLGEAMDFYGEKIRRRKKVKKPDFSEIEKEHIPESLHYILEEEKKKEE